MQGGWGSNREFSFSIDVIVVRIPSTYLLVVRLLIFFFLLFRDGICNEGLKLTPPPLSGSAITFFLYSILKKEWVTPVEKLSTSS